MNRMLIPSQKLKYIKLCIVSPLYEIIANIIYIISFFMLSFDLLSNKSSISNYKSNQIANDVYDRDVFMQIKTEADLFGYIDSLVNHMYKYDPSRNVNIMIPFGSIRLKKYKHNKENCTIDYGRICNDCKYAYYINTIDVCTVNELTRLYDTKSLCGYPYHRSNGVSDPGNDTAFYDSLIKSFEGKYSQYNLVNDGVNYDFVIDNYTANPLEYQQFIQDKDLKFIAILFNVYFPMTDSYIFIIAGVEMVNYFTFPHPIFTATTYINFNTDDAYFLTVFIFFCISVSLNCLKFIYEVNVRFILTIHLLTFFHEVINIIFIVFIGFYMGTSHSHSSFLINYSNNSIGFKDNMPLIIINSYLQIIMSILFLCIPFRVLSLISWSKPGSNQFVKYFSVVFRIIPGVLVLGFIMLMMILVFASMNFFMYNGRLHLFENIFNSLNMLFNFQIIRDVNLSAVLENSVSHSPYFLLYNTLHMTIFGVSFCIGIASFVYLFRKAAAIENDKEDNEVVVKLEEIKEKLSKEIMQYDNNLRGMKKQILWLTLGGNSIKTDLANSPLLKQRVLQFKQSNQIIAFLKYLFALKPDLQFKNLDDKYDIVLECWVVNGRMKEIELEQIDVLLDWLSFVGCKIPVVLYSVGRIERNLRMKIATCYILVRFMSLKEDLFNFLNECGSGSGGYGSLNEEDEERGGNSNKVIDMNHMVSQENRFMIYPSTIIRKSEGLAIGVGLGIDGSSKKSDHDINEDVRKKRNTIESKGQIEKDKDKEGGGLLRKVGSKLKVSKNEQEKRLLMNENDLNKTDSY